MGMKYLIDLPAELVSRIRSQLGEGGDLGSFLLVATENQLALERGLLTPAGASAPPQSQPRTHIPQLFLPSDPASVPTGTAIPAEHSAEVRDRDGNPWVWGQVNRVLPLKCLLRAIVSAAPEGKGLAELHSMLGAPSRTLGRYLAERDEAHQARRDERLSVGFPIGKRREAAELRFVTQFLGETRQDGRVAGALFTLGFVGYTSEQNVKVTEVGLTWSQLPNPVLDEGRTDLSLSLEEQRVYVDHVLSAVPGERCAFTAICGAIAPGQISNDKIEEVLQRGLGSDWTDAVVSTQRSGAMGRMLDLDLLARHRDGRRVSFSLTNSGKAFLASTQGVEVGTK
jgi:hypothetical protein